MQYQGIVASVLALAPLQRARLFCGRRVSRPSVKHTERVGRTSHRVLLPVLLAGVIVLTLGAGSAMARDKDDDKDKLPFSEAHIFFELNDTDGDLGIHALIDGEPWKSLEIEDPHERRMLNIYVSGRLRKQGLTEVFFESAEPPFDELDPTDFFRRFPAGIYEIEAKTLDGKELESKVEVTHVMPAPPVPTVNGNPLATVCDTEEQGYNATEVQAPVTIAWPAVTMSHPDPAGGGAGQQPPIPVTIRNYEIVVEVEVELDNGEQFVSVHNTILPSTVTSITIPAEFIVLGKTFKYEVLAREKSFNQTAVESCFVVVEEE